MPLSRPIGALVLVVTAVAAVGAQPSPKPGADQQRLGVFLGKWTSQGQSYESPYGPAARMTSTEVYTWLPGNFFIEHQWDTMQGSVHIVGREILGYDSASKRYFSQFFDNFGSTGLNHFTVNGNTWTGTADSVVGGKALKERGTVEINGDTMTSKWEYSSDGVKWLPEFDLKLTRVK